MLLIPVHDELVFEVPAKEIDKVKQAVLETMTRAADQVLDGQIPIEVEPVIGAVWKKSCTVPLPLHSTAPGDVSGDLRAISHYLGTHPNIGIYEWGPRSRGRTCLAVVAMQIKEHNMKLEAERLPWVHTFFLKSEKVSLVEDDDVANTFVSCGTIILSAALTGNRTPNYLARFTALPLAFVGLVLALMDLGALWVDEGYVALGHTLEDSPHDLAKVEDRLCWALESLWTADHIGPFYELLSGLRNGVVLGGGQQPFSLNEDDCGSRRRHLQRIQ